VNPVCAIVVNWNGWRDTTACLASLFALDDAPLEILVCDNGSADGSVPHLAAWLDAQDFLRRAGHPPDLEWRPEVPGGRLVAVRILPLDRNLGYAGAINAGIRCARIDWQPQTFRLLNNDVEAQPGALRALLDAHSRTPAAGLCGSVLLEWDEPARVQAVAGQYRRWLAVGAHSVAMPGPPAEVLLDVDYPVGASLLVTAEYLERVGMMEDSYFLYYEEMDWVERGRRQGYRPVVALGSRLRHKEGASTGSTGGVRHKSILSEHYGVVNRLRITRRFWPWHLPTVWLSLWLVAGDRLLHREFRRAALVLRLMFSPQLWLR
jgi:GT2 family glycosyltransferase